MAADLTVEPWKRLTRLAPPRTSTVDLQEAADRYTANNDINAAACDLWEQFAMSIDATDTRLLPESGIPQSINQDGLAVTYRNTAGEIAAMQAVATLKIKYFRQRIRATSVLMNPSTYNAWTGRRFIDNPNFIEVDPDV